ncbi:hypothetical protein AVEN_93786-1 [Araneus ventricosus]|uniref:Uncharacterized protein n=1 Tax=Araneus ventricosus TaxID=182803 RepID=A0A4Y2L6H6_ARAVE|nr:hypothetical protein AVEN_93786-1 [Araneus ventricosus]
MALKSKLEVGGNELSMVSSKEKFPAENRRELMEGYETLLCSGGRNSKNMEKTCQTRKDQGFMHAKHGVIGSPSLQPGTRAMGFHIFESFKKRLEGRHFRTNADVQQAVSTYLLP